MSVVTCNVAIHIDHTNVHGSLLFQLVARNVATHIVHANVHDGERYVVFKLRVEYMIIQFDVLPSDTLYLLKISPWTRLASAQMYLGSAVALVSKVPVSSATACSKVGAVVLVLLGV